MRWFLSKLLGWLRIQKPMLVCRRAAWKRGVAELRKRTLKHTRESGAFLLGRERNGIKEILEFVYYDDIDPESLSSGIVKFSGMRLPVLWEHCRKRGFGVVADVHVHPHGYGQSLSDKSDPVMPRAGHIAIILPDYASGSAKPGGIGIYHYLGNGNWEDCTTLGSSLFRLKL